MAQRPTSMNVSMPRKMRAFIEKRMKAGKFANASEYIRHLVRKDDEAAEVERVRALIEEGLEGPMVPLDKAEWASIRAEARAGLRKRKSK
jgi:antitoxin ParD1/3/4